MPAILLDFPTMIQRINSNDKKLISVGLKHERDEEVHPSSIEIQNLVDAISNNTILAEIDFSGIRIDLFSSPDFEKLFTAIGNHPQIKSLICPVMATPHFEIMARTLAKPLNKLDVSCGPPLSEGDMEALIKLAKRVKLKQLIRRQDRAVAAIAGPIAKWLIENDCVLEVLDLEDGKMGDAGAQVLAAALHNNTSLKHLNLALTSIGNAGAIALAEALKKNQGLQVLNLYCNSFTTATKCIAKAMETNTTLLDLNVSGNRRDETKPLRFAKMLMTNKTLQRLDISHLGMRGSDLFADALKTNTTLKYLNLSGNLISEKYTKKYAEALESNTTLEEFVFGWNDFFSPIEILDRMIQGFDDRNQIQLNTQAFAKWLATTKTLKSLHLESVWLGDAGALILAEGLKHNTSLTHLDLMQNKIGHKGLIAIAQALDKHPNFKSLEVHLNQVTKTSFNSLNLLLKHNLNLQTPVIKDPRLNRDGVSASFQKTQKRYMDGLKKTQEKNESLRHKYRSDLFPRAIEGVIPLPLDVCKLVSEYHEVLRYPLPSEITHPKRKQASEEQSSKKQKLEPVEEKPALGPTHHYFLRPRKQKLNAEAKEGNCPQSQAKKQRLK